METKIIVINHGDYEVWGSFKKAVESHKLPYHSLKTKQMPFKYKGFEFIRVVYNNKSGLDLSKFMDNGKISTLKLIEFQADVKSKISTKRKKVDALKSAKNYAYVNTINAEIQKLEKTLQHIDNCIEIWRNYGNIANIPVINDGGLLTKTEQIREAERQL